MSRDYADIPLKESEVKDSPNDFIRSKKMHADNINKRAREAKTAEIDSKLKKETDKIMTESARDNRRNKSNERMNKYTADKHSSDVRAQIEQSDKESRRKMLTDMVSAILRPLKIGANDPSWYKNIPEVAGFLPSARVMLPKDELANKNLTNMGTSTVMILHYDHSYGNAADVQYSNRLATNSLNSFATRAYTNIRSHSSRLASSAEAGDLLLYLVGGTNLYEQLLRLIKAVKAAYTFNYYNKALGDKIIMACGFIPSQIRDNLADIKAWIFQTIEELNSVVVLPHNKDIFTYVSRKMFMASGIYSDDKEVSPNIYVFTSVRWLEYDEINSRIKTSMHIIPGSDSWATFTTRFKTCINAFKLSSAVTSLVADIKASGLPIFEFPRISESDLSSPLVIPSIDEVKDQIMNATLPVFIPDCCLTASSGGTSVHMSYTTYFTDYIPTDTSMVLGQDSSGILYVGTNTNAVYRFKPGTASGTNLSQQEDYMTNLKGSSFELLNLYKDNPNDDDILVATRLHTTYNYFFEDDSSGCSWYTNAQHCATEFLTHITVLGTNYSFACNGLLPLSKANCEEAFMAIPFITRFNYHPNFFLADGAAITGVTPNQYWIEYANYGPQWLQQLGNVFEWPDASNEALHRACVGSLFYCIPARK